MLPKTEAIQTSRNAVASFLGDIGAIAQSPPAKLHCIRIGWSFRHFPQIVTGGEMPPNAGWHQNCMDAEGWWSCIGIPCKLPGVTAREGKALDVPGETRV
jgi:hypothetical protein